MNNIGKGNRLTGNTTVGKRKSVSDGTTTAATVSNTSGAASGGASAAHVIIDDEESNPKYRNVFNGDSLDRMESFCVSTSCSTGAGNRGNTIDETPIISMTENETPIISMTENESKLKLSRQR